MMKTRQNSLCSTFALLLVAIHGVPDCMAAAVVLLSVHGRACVYAPWSFAASDWFACWVNVRELRE